MIYNEFEEQLCKNLKINVDKLDFSQKVFLKTLFEEIKEQGYAKGFKEGRSFENTWRL